MKLASIFFTASAENLGVYLKDTHKRARNMKLASIFFTASAEILEFISRYGRLAWKFVNKCGLFPYLA